MVREMGGCVHGYDVRCPSEDEQTERKGASGTRGASRENEESQKSQSRAASDRPCCRDDLCSCHASILPVRLERTLTRRVTGPPVRFIIIVIIVIVGPQGRTQKRRRHLIFRVLQDKRVGTGLHVSVHDQGIIVLEQERL